MGTWLDKFREGIDLDYLAGFIRGEGKPIHVRILSQKSLRQWLEKSQRKYAPGAKYSKEESIFFKGQMATVKAVREGSNPKQGHFEILTLELADGTSVFIASDVPEHSRGIRLQVKNNPGWLFKQALANVLCWANI